MCPTEDLEEFEHYAAGGLRLAETVLFAGGIHLVGWSRSGDPCATLTNPSRLCVM